MFFIFFPFFFFLLSKMKTESPEGSELTKHIETSKVIDFLEKVLPMPFGQSCLMCRKFFLPGNIRTFLSLL